MHSMSLAVAGMIVLLLSGYESASAAETALLTEFNVGDAQLLPENPVRFYEYTENNGQPLIHFGMSEEDAERFGDFTKQHIGQIMEMRVCGELVSAPVIREAIYGGQGVLSGPKALQTMQAFLANGCP